VATNGSDSNTGTLEQPFRNVSRGVQVLKAGDVLYIRGGRYWVRIYETEFTSTGTSWSSPITIAGYPGELVTLEGGDGAIGFNNGSVSYVIYKDFKLQGASISLNSSSPHHIRLQNLEIVDSPHNGVIAGGSFHEFIDLNVHGAGWAAVPTATTSCDNGLYLAGDNFLVQGGSFWNNHSYGIRLYDSDPSAAADNGTIKGTRIYQNGGGFGLNGTSSSTCGGGAIVASENGHAIYNNLVYGNFSGITVYAQGPTPNGIKVDNNTIANNRHFAVLVEPGAQNTLVRNTIAFGNGNGILNNGSGTVLVANSTSDPLFANASQGDFSLRTGSPAIDAGTTLSNITDDFSGVRRPAGNGYDLGALEAPGPASALSTPANFRQLP
jgi:hypothetical protein